MLIRESLHDGLNTNTTCINQLYRMLYVVISCPIILYTGFYLLGGGAGGSFPPKVLLNKNLQLFQIKIFFDDDFKESVKVTNVQKCDFSQS